jgi:menaquinone-dependent protoporphyrinogen oxidase
MRVLVIYGSRLGSTQGIAERIATRLRQDRLEITLQPAPDGPAFTDADAFVIGSGVYGGRWVKEASDFVRQHRTVLVHRPVWMFSSGPVGDLATRHAPVEPKDVAGLRSTINPREHRIFGGALDRGAVDSSTLGFAERLIAKTMVPEGDYRDWQAIDDWAAGIARELARIPARRPTWVIGRM